MGKQCWECSSVIECIPGMQEALSSISSTEKTKTLFKSLPDMTSQNVIVAVLYRRLRGLMIINALFRFWGPVHYPFSKLKLSSLIWARSMSGPLQALSPSTEDGFEKLFVSSVVEWGRLTLCCPLRVEAGFMVSFAQSAPYWKSHVDLYRAWQ